MILVSLFPYFQVISFDTFELSYHDYFVWQSFPTFDPLDYFKFVFVCIMFGKALTDLGRWLYIIFQSSMGNYQFYRLSQSFYMVR